MDIISILATGTLGLQILIALGLLIFIFGKRSKLYLTISKNSILISFLIASVATISSLFLSEIMHFPPCKLCWYQRIFMYPMVLVLGVSLLINDTKARITTFALSGVGLAISIYHILLQNWPGIFPCSDEIANCALKQFTYFGYVTIPVMSATAFTAIILLMMFGLRKSR